MAILELENLYEYFCEIEAIFFNMSISRPDRLVSNNIGDYKFCDNVPLFILNIFFVLSNAALSG